MENDPLIRTRYVILSCKKTTGIDNEIFGLLITYRVDSMIIPSVKLALMTTERRQSSPSFP